MQRRGEGGGGKCRTCNEREASVKLGNISHQDEIQDMQAIPIQHIPKHRLEEGQLEKRRFKRTPEGCVNKKLDFISVCDGEPLKISRQEHCAQLCSSGRSL